ncbi:MAG TPA: beta-eliminating lyase-related protein, partial [Rectinemataceae bacterium]|nr:beta-eliminating lyase-related protein [Rectinemataceae bacterium]
MTVSLELAPLLPPTAGPVTGSAGVDLRPAPLSYRMAALRRAGYNTALLTGGDLFLDAVASSAGRDLPAPAAEPDARSESLEAAVKRLFGLDHSRSLPRGLSAERVVCAALVKPGDTVATNCRFATTRDSVEALGGQVLELHSRTALQPDSVEPFKGDMDLKELALLAHSGRHLACIRMEASANLLGGQPFSLANLRAVSGLAREFHLPLVLDASFLESNLAVMRAVEPGLSERSLRDLCLEIGSLCDILYFSGSRPPRGRGGAVACRSRELLESMLGRVPKTGSPGDYDGGPPADESGALAGLVEAVDGAGQGGRSSPALAE